MSSVHIGICHNDYLVVTDLFNIESTFLITIADTGANCGDHSLNFLILESSMQTGLLNINDLTTKRQNGLSRSITSRLRGTTSRVTLNNEDFRFSRISFGAIRQLAGKTTSGHYRLANGLASLASRFTSTRRIDRFVDYCFG